MEDLETLRLLFESQGVHFREGDLADLDNNDDNEKLVKILMGNARMRSIAYGMVAGFAKTELMSDFEGLCGFSGIKPFECVGTAREVNACLELTLGKYEGVPKPALLSEYEKRRRPVSEEEIKRLFGEFNEINGIPAEFIPAVEGMHKYVSAVD